MAANLITVVLKSDERSDENLYLDDLRDLSLQLGNCLAATERTITDSKATLKYRLSQLEQHSIAIGIGGAKSVQDGELLQNVASLFNATTQAIQNGSPIDSRFDDDSLRAFREMVDRLSHKGRKLAVSGVVLTTQFVANIDKLLSESLTSHGTIKGRVERQDIHNRNQFTLFTPLADAGIVCTYESDQYDLVQKAFGHNVTVTGKLHFRGGEGIPVRVNMTDLEIHPNDDELPTLASLRGLLSDAATGGLSAVDFVHALRDGES